jgi:hypothetical protein
MPEQQNYRSSRKRQPKQYDRLQRERGPSHPQKRPDGPFEARSFMPHKDGWLITRHQEYSKAEKRLAGNPRHTKHQIIDHSRDAELAEVEKFKARKTKGKKDA